MKACDATGATCNGPVVADDHVHRLEAEPVDHVGLAESVQPREPTATSTARRSASTCPAPQHVSFRVVNGNGQTIQGPHTPSGTLGAGDHVFTWDGRNNAGQVRGRRRVHDRRQHDVDDRGSDAAGHGDRRRHGRPHRARVLRRSPAADTTTLLPSSTASSTASTRACTSTKAARSGSTSRRRAAAACGCSRIRTRAAARSSSRGTDATPPDGSCRPATTTTGSSRRIAPGTAASRGCRSCASRTSARVRAAARVLAQRQPRPDVGHQLVLHAVQPRLLELRARAVARQLVRPRLRRQPVHLRRLHDGGAGRGPVRQHLGAGARRRRRTRRSRSRCTSTTSPNGTWDLAGTRMLTKNAKPVTDDVRPDLRAPPREPASPRTRPHRRARQGDARGLRHRVGVDVDHVQRVVASHQVR